MLTINELEDLNGIVLNLKDHVRNYIKFKNLSEINCYYNGYSAVCYGSSSPIFMAAKEGILNHLKTKIDMLASEVRAKYVDPTQILDDLKTMK